MGEEALEPFTLATPEAVLLDLKERLEQIEIYLNRGIPKSVGV